MNNYLKIGVIYSLVKYLIMGLGVIKSFLIASELGPIFLGSYAVVMLIVEYLNYVNLGVFASMNRDVAIHMENEKKKDYVDKIINVAISFTIIPLLFVIFSFLFFGFFDFKFLPSELYDYAFLILLLVSLNQLKIFLMRYLRLYDRFYELTALEFFAQLINLTGVILFIGKYSIDAVIWSILASNIFFNVIAFTYVKKLKFFIDFKTVKYLIFSGFPMLIYAVTLTLLSSVDRIAILSAFDNRISLGLYQFGFVAAQGLFMAFNSITFLFYPRWLKYFYQEEGSSVKFQQLKLQSLIVELILVGLSIFGIAFIPFFIQTFLPNYEVSILVSQFLLLALILNGLTFLTSTFLISNNHQLKIFPIISFTVISAFILNLFFISLGYGLYGIAFSTIIAFFSYAILMTILTLSMMNLLSLKNILIFYKRLFLFIPLTVFFLYEKFSFLWIFVSFLLIYFLLIRDLLKKTHKFYILRENKTLNE